MKKVLLPQGKFSILRICENVIKSTGEASIISGIIFITPYCSSL